MDLKKVLIYCSKEEINNVLKMLISDNFELIFKTTTLNLWKEISLDMPDVILIGDHVGEFNGINICKTYRQDKKYLPQNIPLPPILYINYSNTDETTIYNAGAINIIRFPIGKKQITSMLNAIIEKENKISKTIEVGPFNLDYDNFEIKYNKSKIHITVTEFRIIYCLMTNIGTVVSREKLQILTNKDGEYLSERNIDTHICHLRKKFSKTNLFIESIYGEGYCANLKSEVMYG